MLPPLTSASRVPPSGRRTTRTRTRRAGWPCPGRSAPATTRASSLFGSPSASETRRRRGGETAETRLENSRASRGRGPRTRRRARASTRRAERAASPPRSVRAWPEDAAASRNALRDVFVREDDDIVTLLPRRHARFESILFLSSASLEPRARSAQARCATMTPSANAMVARATSTVAPGARRSPTRAAPRARARRLFPRNRRRAVMCSAVVVSRSAAPLADARASPPAPRPTTSSPQRDYTGELRMPPVDRGDPRGAPGDALPRGRGAAPGIDAGAAPVRGALPRAPGRGHRADRRFVRAPHVPSALRGRAGPAHQPGRVAGPRRGDRP